MNENKLRTPEPPAPFDFDQLDFVTSDHHFGHARIIELAGRPYASLGAMHGELIAAWNRVLGPEDVVLHLVDLAQGNREESITVTAALIWEKGVDPRQPRPDILDLLMLRAA